MTVRMTVAEYGATATEADIRKAGYAYLRIQAWWFYPNAQTGMGVHKGITDITAIKAGRVVWIEFKRPNRRHAKNGGLSPDQVIFRDHILREGGEYLPVYDVEDLYVLGDERQGVLR